MLDLDFLRSPDGGEVLTSDPEIVERLRNFADAHEASLVIDRKAVVAGAPGFDATKEASLYLEAFRKTGTKPNLRPTLLASLARMAVIDRQALLNSSRAGASLAEQIRTRTKNNEDAVRSESEDLKQERADLEYVLATLPDDEKSERTADLERREAELHEKVQRQKDQLKAAIAVAQKQIEDAAVPIVLEIMKSRGADLVVDRQAVVIGARGFDMTTLAIEKLDAALAHVDLVLDQAP
ncbi:MAG TPA: OmpH family outer membrane protein [Rhizomicrobium sp.]|nr:OmpH family outer membrane protein [Rhizomicrobium sp.]